MNKISFPHVTTDTGTGLGSDTAVDAGTVERPLHEPVVSVNATSPTTRIAEVSFTNPLGMSRLDFEKELARIFVSLLEGQEPLGREFEAIWEENLDALYQS